MPDHPTPSYPILQLTNRTPSHPQPPAIYPHLPAIIYPQTRYAAYTLEDGSVIGDKANLELTEAIIGNGWIPPSPRGHFDILPIVLETSGNEIRMFDVPAECAR